MIVAMWFDIFVIYILNILIKRSQIAVIVIADVYRVIVIVPKQNDPKFMGNSVLHTV